MPSLRALRDLENSIAMLENATGYRSKAEASHDMAAVVGEEMAYDYMYINRDTFEDALNVYSRASINEIGFLVLGRQQNVFSDGDESTPNYPMIDQALVANFGRLNDYVPRSGSVLRARNWTMYLNDMFVLGGIANRQPFYLASQRHDYNLWDVFENRATLFAREIAGLFMAGYELRRLPDGSEMMHAPSGRRVSLNLQQYIRRLPAYLRTVPNIDQMTEPGLLRLIYRSPNAPLIRVRTML